MKVILTQDIHELDEDYQQRVVDTYLNLATVRNNWVVIECIDHKNNELRTIESIHKDIVQAVNQKLRI